MKIDLTPLIQALISVAAALITAYLVPYIKSHTDINKRQLVLSIVETAVKWVEQVYWEEEGEDKFELALERIEEELDLHHISVDTKSLVAMIEEAVLKLHEELKREDKKEDEDQEGDEEEEVLFNAERDDLDIQVEIE